MSVWARSRSRRSACRWCRKLGVQLLLAHPAGLRRVSAPGRRGGPGRWPAPRRCRRARRGPRGSRPLGEVAVGERGHPVEDQGHVVRVRHNTATANQNASERRRTGEASASACGRRRGRPCGRSSRSSSTSVAGPTAARTASASGAGVDRDRVRRATPVMRGRRARRRRRRPPDRRQPGGQPGHARCSPARCRRRTGSDRAARGQVAGVDGPVGDACRRSPRAAAAAAATQRLGQLHDVQVHDVERVEVRVEDQLRRVAGLGDQGGERGGQSVRSAPCRSAADHRQLVERPGPGASRTAARSAARSGCRRRRCRPGRAAPPGPPRCRRARTPRSRPGR